MNLSMTLIGPMVYSACFCDGERYEEFKKLEFDDSKEINESIRDEKFLLLQSNDIREYSGWVSHILSPQEISHGMLKRYFPRFFYPYNPINNNANGIYLDNINNILTNQHLFVINRNKYNLNSLAHDTTISIIQHVIKSGYTITHIYIDTVGPPESYTRKLEPIFPGIKIKVAKKADSLYPIVSAASICAKVSRDLIVKHWVFTETLPFQISSAYGSGYPSDPKTKDWLNKNIDKVFGYPSIVRFSWATCQKLLETNAYKVNFHNDIDNANSSSAKLTVAQKRKLSMNILNPSGNQLQTLPPPQKSSYLKKNNISLFPQF
ncbi:Ribonuclease H2 subunit A [Smittium culicis]|uniref:Ribonuclease n=1 Tax=Smittium culicis TaxID=133412 RepID=A0A1R1Y6L2_9FUNG|nr:Ribonuclease H2 subunit A [Smittium culicis]